MVRLLQLRSSVGRDRPGRGHCRPPARTPGRQAVKPFSTVLIADGDAEVRAQYRAAFSQAAEAIHESEDGAEALGKAICHLPDLLVAETRLRRIDGLSLCRLLRDDPT